MLFFLYVFSGCPACSNVANGEDHRRGRDEQQRHMAESGKDCDGFIDRQVGRDPAGSPEIVVIGCQDGSCCVNGRADAVGGASYDGVFSFDGPRPDGLQVRILNGLPVCGGTCLLYTSPSPRDRTRSRMPSSA